MTDPADYFTPPTPQPPRSRSASRPGQAADDTERARRRLLDIDIAIADRPQLRHAGLIQLGDDVIIQLDDIGHGAAGGLDRNLEIGEDLFDLRFEIALADQLARSVARYLAGKIDDRSAIDLGDVRIAGRARGNQGLGLMNSFDGLLMNFSRLALPPV
jgi:hypothetical protein